MLPSRIGALVDDDTPEEHLREVYPRAASKVMMLTAGGIAWLNNEVFAMMK